jgi:peptide/nickel transport system substrate-binding protein
VNTRVRPSEFSAWFSRLGNGEFEGAIAWSSEGADPYFFYRYLMSQETVVPVGESTPANWHRFGDPRVDGLMKRFEGATEDTERHAIMAETQQLFMELAPAIPLFPSPVWAAYSTERFEGFPTKDNPYAMPSPNNAPDRLLVLTSLKPRPEREVKE